MTKVWRRLIAVLEIVGGAFGILILAWELIVSQVDGFVFLLSPIAYGIYILSLGAGVLLWREHRAGRTASIIVQAIQLPKLISPLLTFSFSFGFDFYLYVQSEEGFSKAGADLKLLAFHQLYLNMHEAPIGAGISIPAVVFLIILLRSRPESERSVMAPPPPPTSSDWNDAVTYPAPEQGGANVRESVAFHRELDGTGVGLVASDYEASHSATEGVKLELQEKQDS